MEGVRDAEGETEGDSVPLPVLDTEGLAEGLALIELEEEAEEEALRVMLTEGLPRPGRVTVSVGWSVALGHGEGCIVSVLWEGEALEEGALAEAPPEAVRDTVGVGLGVGAPERVREMLEEGLEEAGRVTLGEAVG